MKVELSIFLEYQSGSSQKKKRAHTFFWTIHDIPFHILIGVLVDHGLLKKARVRYTECWKFVGVGQIRHDPTNGHVDLDARGYRFLSISQGCRPNLVLSGPQNILIIAGHAQRRERIFMQVWRSGKRSDFATEHASFSFDPRYFLTALAQIKLLTLVHQNGRDVFVIFDEYALQQHHRYVW